MVDLGIDPSVFERAAALLNRPLSPTALEKEQLQKGRQAPEPQSSRKPQAKEPQAKAKGKAKAKAAPVVELPADEQPGSTVAVEPSVEPELPVIDTPEVAITGIADDAPPILAAVAELSGLQKDWKQKINSPSYRKAPVPRVNRKEPKTLTDEERHEKLGEIDALEQQLEAAKVKAAEVTAAAQRATEWVSQRAIESGAIDGESCEDNGTEPQSQEYRHLAEERVKERRRKEIHERREREKREALEKQAKQLGAEAKVKELEQITKQRMHSRLREEKEKQQREKEEASRQQQEKEERAAAAEELRIQTAKRVAEREQALRRKAMEEEALQAEERRRQEEENEAKAEEGRERTRLRMQQRAQETRAKQLLEEEARQRQIQEEAAKEAARQSQAEISRQRARARAAEFRERSRQEEEEKARLQAEEEWIRQEQSEAALLERQRKRNYRLGDPPVSQSPRYARQPSPCGSKGGDAEQESNRPVTADSLTNYDDLPVKAVSSEARPRGSVVSKAVPQRTPSTEGSKAVSKAVPQRTPSTEGSNATKPPPRPPTDRTNSKLNKNAVSAAVAPKAKSKPQASNVNGKARARSPSVEVPAREGRSNAAQVTEASEDGPVRCTVGFFGVNDVDYLDDEDEDCENAFVSEERPPPVQSVSVAKNHARRNSSESNHHRKASPQPRKEVQASQPTKMARAYSQPPPSRPPVMPGSRPDSPATPDGRYHAVPDFRLNSPGNRCAVADDGRLNSPMLLSPGAVSNRSDPSVDRPAARQQAQPWKQKAINVKPADFYLNQLKVARGQAPANSGSSPPKKSAVLPVASEGSEAAAWGEGPKSYADMMRMRARVVEVTQRQEESEKFDRTNAVLQRVQQRAAQVPLRSASS